jgi:hypothetical protein
MKKSLKLSLMIAAATIALLVSGEHIFARGAASNIMNSPGYQRRLQESRQQVSQPDVQRSYVQPHKSRHRHRN